MKEYIVQARAQETIDSFDAHNAPELIRCKDCKHYEPEDKLCCHPFGAVVGKIPDDFYCGYGEW